MHESVQTDRYRWQLYTQQPNILDWYTAKLSRLDENWAGLPPSPLALLSLSHFRLITHSEATPREFSSSKNCRPEDYVTEWVWLDPPTSTGPCVCSFTKYGRKCIKI